MLLNLLRRQTWTIHLYTHIHTYTNTYQYFHIYVSHTHDFLPINLILLQHFRIFSSPLLFIFINFFSNTDRPGFHYPQSICLVCSINLSAEWNQAPEHSSHLLHAASRSSTTIPRHRLCHAGPPPHCHTSSGPVPHKRKKHLF